MPDQTKTDNFQCTKIPYKTRSRAQRAKVRAATDGIKQKGSGMRPKYKTNDLSVYKCIHCGFWHWGHQPKNKQKRK